jgi:hypothetical protein
MSARKKAVAVPAVSSPSASAPTIAFDLKRAAAESSCSVWFLRLNIKKGNLRARLAGKKFLIVAEDLADFVKHLPRRRAAMNGTNLEKMTNLYKVTVKFDGKTLETEVRAGNQRFAINRAIWVLIPEGIMSAKAGASFSCELVKRVPKYGSSSPPCVKVINRDIFCNSPVVIKPLVMSQTLQDKFERQLEKKSDTILMDPAKCEVYEMPCKAAATKLIEMKIKGG